MPTCAECVYAELQCPPVVRCQKKGIFVYLDTPSCEEFKPVEDKGNPKDATSGSVEPPASS